MTSQETKKEEKLSIVSNPNLLENIVSKAIKVVSYSFGAIPIIPNILKNGSLSNSHGFSMQSKKITEYEETIYVSKKIVKPKFQNVRSVPQLFFDAAKRNPKDNCLGKRKLLSKSVESVSPCSKEIIRYTFGNYVWKDYQTVAAEITWLAYWLLKHGFDNHNKMAIFGHTSDKWLEMSLALCSISSPFVTVFPNLDDSEVIHALKLTEVYGVMVDEKTLPRLMSFLNDLPTIQYIIVYSHIERVSLNKENFPKKIVLKSFDCIIENFMVQSKGRKLGRIKKFIDQIIPEDLCVIMFTSGSSKTPKGVMISHKNIICGINSVSQNKEFNNFQSSQNISQGVFAAFLPAAHIFEFTFEICMLSLGTAIGFCTPLTLFDTSPMIEEGSKGDLSVLCPTIMITVPLLLERIKDNILSKISNLPRLKQIMFETFFNIKYWYFKHGYSSPIIDKLIFNEIKAIFGGRLNTAFIGGASIVEETEIFANVCLGRFCQGYGLTESTSGICAVPHKYQSIGKCGPPLQHCKIKLVNWDEGKLILNSGGYSSNNNPPTGEILLSGESIAMGYYKDPKTTYKVFFNDPITNERWFRTEDIGMITPDGCLKIIDRKKNIIKLCGGEYVSLVCVESEFKKIHFLQNICVLPENSNKHLVAFVLIDFEELKKFLKTKNVLKEFTKIDDLRNDTNIMTLIETEITETAYSKLTKTQRPKLIHYKDDEWTPENGLLTPTMKIRRHKIAQHYIDDL